MKTLFSFVFLVLWLLPNDIQAAPCTVGAPFDEDGCQTTSVPWPQGDFMIMSYHLCEEKDNAELSCATAGSVADPDFDLVADAAGIPERIMFSVDNITACNAGVVTFIGRNTSNGDDHIVGTIDVTVAAALFLVEDDWRHQFVTATIAGLANCTADSFNVGMRLYYRKIHR